MRQHNRFFSGCLMYQLFCITYILSLHCGLVIVWHCGSNFKMWMFLFLPQGKAAHSMPLEDLNDGAGSPLFTFVDENIFKKETFLGKCMREKIQKWIICPNVFPLFLWKEAASYTTALSEKVSFDIISTFHYTICLFGTILLVVWEKLLRRLLISLWRTAACFITSEHAESSVIDTEIFSSTTAGFFKTFSAWKLLIHICFRQYLFSDVFSVYCASRCPSTELYRRTGNVTADIEFTLRQLPS